MTHSSTDPLLELAGEYAIATEYWDWRGQHVQVSEETIRAVLTALGVDVFGPEAVPAALERRRLGRWAHRLPPYLVTRASVRPVVHTHVTHGDPVELWITLEDGTVRRDLCQVEHNVDPVRLDGRLVGEAAFQLPADLPLGWHRLHARCPRGESDIPLVVTPDRLELPAALAEKPGWGFMTQLYATPSRRSWSLGDLGDLADLAAWSGHQLDASFLLINPLHAAEPVAPMEPSPYLPTTRRFANPIYLRVEQVPEYAYLSAVDQAVVAALAEGVRKSGGDADQLDRDLVWAAKRQALELVRKVERSPGREAAYQAFLAREGDGLRDFATWCALAEEYGTEWDSWPAELHDPASPAVAAARESRADLVDFHRWTQWLLDEQLAVAQQTAGRAGMSVGIMHDLAVGVHPCGADSWALQHVLASGISVGAPADAFNQQGQDWAQPPWRPDRLAEVGFAPYRDLLRTVLRHAGGIRIDHIIGLFRLWWVPEGSQASEGTYVRYDHEAMLGILVLEAHRAGAVVVGEDLGTVEPWVAGYLADRGLLGTSILWFERDHQGQPLPAEQWRRLCLATVTSHDLPPTAGYLAGDHITLRDELGLLTRPVEQERAEDEAGRRAWLEHLAARGLLSDVGADEERLVVALHRFLRTTPSRLLGVALPDAVGDRRTQNQPGTKDEYPNWRVELTDHRGQPVLLEDLPASARLGAVVNAVRGLQRP